MRIPICIVEDNEQIRSAITEIIDIDNGYKIKGCFSNAEEAMKKIPSLKPRLVLMDIHLGNGKNGIDCVKYLKAASPDILIMMYTVYDDAEKIFDALRSGANGYVLKKTSPQQLLDALKELYEGGAPMSSQIARKIVRHIQNENMSEIEMASSTKKTLSKLTQRENEILELLAKGLFYKEIADQFSISPETVKKHAYRIYEKLHVNNKVEAINKFLDR